METRKKILMAGFYPDQLTQFKIDFPQAEFVDVQDDQLAEHQADALVSLTETVLDRLFVSETLNACKTLKWVHASSAGVDNYYPMLQSIHFELTCGKIIQGPPVADHAMALLLALTRRLAWSLKGVRPTDMPRPTELNGKTALIYGLGGIGMSIAERAAAFGMKVKAVTETNMPILSFISDLHYDDELEDILSDVDVVFISAPLTPITKKRFDAKILKIIKKGAYLINVSRGEIIDFEALSIAVANKQFSGVGLDVTDPEPLPENHPVLSAENVLITPHYAGTTTTHERRFDLIRSNIRRFLNNRPLINKVDNLLGF